jgi:hypothetical protein
LYYLYDHVSFFKIISFVYIQPINVQSLERIKKSVKMMSDIPVLFGKYASFQSTCDSNPEVLSVSNLNFKERYRVLFLRLSSALIPL